MHKEKFSATFKGKRYDHLWGYEVWVENNEIYCNKLLVLNSGFTSSWHYHERKDETFVILEGEVLFFYAPKDSMLQTCKVLRAGDTFRIKPFLVHSFQSLTERSVVMEVSTTDDNDNVKLSPARRLEDEAL